ncbi:MAG TPA: DUF502 domain-containing protein [Candidatus Polarisedimenticolia bacterium]|nr:DUF502 domain-containing protein [Candidatus Polarisedimenticolia bacterium]
MKSILGFLKTTIVGGLFYLLPLGIALYLVAKALRVLSKITTPLADSLPVEKQIVGFALADILGILLILVGCFVAGLIAATGLGRTLVARAESLILKKVPGYTLLRSVTSEDTLPTGARLESALARIEDAWVLAFIVERDVDGLVAVFVPASPSPTDGAIYYLEPDRVRPIDLPVRTTAKLIMQLGVGSAEALRGKIGPVRPA